jgi:hypothetical protein
MGGMIETDKMLAHAESCAVCQAAGTKYMDRCDAWSDMCNNYIDWQCAEGPFEPQDGEEDGPMMCPKCDGPVDKDNYCRACQRTMICACPSDQACDICDPYGMWRREQEAN